MNLATRCLSCGTVFRVAEAQLQASEGWVRCGRCDGVFNAAEVLFDIDSGAPMRLDLGLAGEAVPPLAQPPLAAPPPSVAAPAPPPVDSVAHWPDGPLLRSPSRVADDEPDEPIVITDHVAPPPTSASPAPLVSQATLAAAPDDHALWADRPETVGLHPATAGRPVGSSLASTAVAVPPLPPPEHLPTPVQSTPSFLRRAERTARWQHPAMRSGLWAGVLLLGLALLLQMALLWRDSLAAHLPRSAPVLQALCRLAGCSVLPLRRIQQLSVTSSGLNRLDGSSLYRLQLVLHNRADTAVMVPALDLTLTDPQGQLVARRVLPMAELGVAQTALQAGQDLPIKVLMSTGEHRVEGYTLEVFYP